MPTAVVEPTVMVMIEVPVPVMDVGLKPTVTVPGWPLALKATAELKPFTTVEVIVEFPALPCATETEVGEAERLKVGAVPAVTSALIKPALGLPQPVTKS